MRTSRVRVVCAVLLTIGLSAVLVLQGHAIETARLSLGNIEGDGWSISDLSMDINWTGSATARAVLQAGTADLPGKLGTVTALQFVCDQAELTNTGFACSSGKLDFRSSRFGRQSLPAVIHYNHVDKSIRLRLRSLRLAGGRVTLAASYLDSNWSADIKGNALVLSALARELKAAGIRPIAVGGDHTVPLPVLRALASDGPVGLLQFDAHAEAVVMGPVRCPRINTARSRDSKTDRPAMGTMIREGVSANEVSSGVSPDTTSNHTVARGVNTTRARPAVAPRPSHNPNRASSGKCSCCLPISAIAASW